MRGKLFLTSLLMVFAATFARASTQAPNVGVERFGLYVVSSDLDRASAFYEQIFEKKPYIKNAGLVGFEVAGGLYAIVSENAYASGVKRGDNVLPYIRVKDIEAAFAHVKKIAPDSIRSPGIVTEGPFRFFKFADPDGNIVEFFWIVPAPKG